MIVRIRRPVEADKPYLITPSSDPCVLVPCICDDNGTEVFLLPPMRVDFATGELLDVRLPGLDWASLVTMT